MRKGYNQRGQVLLLVLLGVTGVLFLVLSAASRGVMDVSLSSREADSAKAFAAAEAGIEAAISNGQFSATQADESAYSSQLLDNTTGISEYAYPAMLASGEAGNIWFLARDEAKKFTCSNGAVCYYRPTLELCWGDTDVQEVPSETPAVEVTLYYDVSGGAILGSTPNFAGVRQTRAVFDPNIVRTAENAFTPITSLPSGLGCQIEGQSYRYSYNLNLNSSDFGIPTSCFSSGGCLAMMNVRMLYNPTGQGFGVKAQAGSYLPSQGRVYESTGSFGETLRKVKLTQTDSEIDAVFTQGLFAGGEIN